MIAETRLAAKETMQHEPTLLEQCALLELH